MQKSPMVNIFYERKDAIEEIAIHDRKQISILIMFAVKQIKLFLFYPISMEGIDFSTSFDSKNIQNYLL